MSLPHRARLGRYLPEDQRLSGFSMGRECPYLYGHEKDGPRCLVWRREDGHVAFIANNNPAEMNIYLAHDAAWKLNGCPTTKAIKDGCH